MKRTTMIWIAGVIIFIMLCNIIPALNNISIFLGEGKFIDNGYERYITKDKRLVTMSLEGLKNKVSDNPEEYYYSEYRKSYLNSDATLYRIDPIYFFRFWRWREYLFAPQWRQPYFSMSENEWNKIQDKMWENDRKYGTPFPRDTVNVSKK
jgi:hypothetical protein